MKRDLTIVAVTVAIVGLGLFVGGTATARRARPEPAPHLTDAAPSVDALLGRFLAALADGDRAALERLRVNEREYLDIILPRSVEPEAPLQRMPPDKARFFWDLLNTKSAYSAQHLLNQFGGQRYRVKQVAYAKGKKTYAGFTGYEQLRLTLEDTSGQERELRTGSIVEVHGAFKFVSFIRD
jgi:hypothetical protein